MLLAAQERQLFLYDAERMIPSMLYQRIPACLAQPRWGIQNEEALSAIACHTTLRTEASALDMALFIADKLAWEPRGPFFDRISAAAERARPDA